MMKEQLNHIKNQIEALEKIGATNSVFGSSKHKFILNPPLAENKLVEFESNNNINLPSEYRNFLKIVGNGGAGPFYGLEPLENGKFEDLDYKEKGKEINLSEPFKFNERWNLEFDEIKDEKGEVRNDIVDNEYYNSKWADGMLRISNFGCGVSINLIVNGKEYGNIWVDDRCNDQGIFPYQPNNKNRITFLDWYVEWLEDAIIKTTK